MKRPLVGIDMAKVDAYRTKVNMAELNNCVPALLQSKMNMRRIQYGYSLYNSKDLKAYAEQYLAKLPLDVTHLISRGASGCAIASAMLTLSQRPLDHLFLRKGERAHSSDYTGCTPSESTDIGAFVDDFMATGETAAYVLDWDSNNWEKIKYILVHRLDYPIREMPILQLCQKRQQIIIIEVEECNED